MTNPIFNKTPTLTNVQQRMKKHCPHEIVHHFYKCAYIDSVGRDVLFLNKIYSSIICLSLLGQCQYAGSYMSLVITRETIFFACKL